MKILHVNMSLDPVSGGGTAERTSKLNLALDELEGVEARVLTTDAGLEDLNSLPIPPRQAVVLPCWNRRWYLPAPYFMKVYRMIAWADVIHLMNHWTLLNAWVYLLARWLRKPYVVCSAGAIKIYGRSGFLKRGYNLLIGNSILKHARALIAITEDEAVLFRQIGIPADKIVHIPNGVWERDFRYKDERLFRETFQLGDAPFILYVGRLSSIKGPDILMEAFTVIAGKHPDVHLVIIGPDDGMLASLQSQADAGGLSDRIHLIGFAGGDLKSSAYHGAELLVVPSRHEAMSIVALEAGICGTPVLLSDQCGFDSLAEAGGGKITSIRIESMAESLEALLKDRTVLAKMGTRAKEYISKNFSWTIAAKRHLELYRKISPEGSTNSFGSVENFLKSHAFSIAIAVNIFSITVFMIALSFLGYGEAAADVGLVHGATIAVFLAFSANARNLILGRESSFHLKQQFVFRGIMFLPLVFIAFYLSGGVVETSGLLTVAIILRRCAEWFAELQICAKEKADDKGYAYRFITVQTVGFSLLLFSFMLGNEPFYNFTLFLWACSPAFQIFPFIASMVPQCMKGMNINFRGFLPHLGSSWIIALSTFAFRILIALLVAKPVAGILYSAFAIGGMINAIYTYAIGPSLIFKQDRVQAAEKEKFTHLIVAAHCLAGLLIIGLVSAGNIVGSEAAFFVKAIGFSVAGGGIMILAQRRRIITLQIQKDNVFVPDVLVNILIISTVPFAFYLLGPDILPVLFFWNSCLNYIVYALPSIHEQLPEKNDSITQSGQSFWKLNRSKIQIGVLAFLIFPVFFQFSGNFIFDDPVMLFDSQGMLTQLPIPITVIACFPGIALLIRFKETQISARVLFGLFIAMLFSTFAISMDNKFDALGKFILLIQYILPLFGLVLGQSYIAPKHPKFRFEAIFLYILAFIIPVEMLATLIQGTGVLTPYLYVFSIYQHLQYLPVIFIGLYFVALLSLYENRNMKILLLLLAPFVGAYTAASASNLAGFLLVTGSLVSLFLLIRRKHWRFGIAVVLLLSSLFILYYAKMSSHPFFIHKFGLEEVGEQGSLKNVQDRFTFWKIHWSGIWESSRHFLFGHEKALSRDLVPSAHNYYLDLVYNFGFISLLPFIFLIGYTVRKLYRVARTTTVSYGLIGLTGFVLFCVLIDNSLKVGFRQPYPGIIMFFLWGVLLSRLSNASNTNQSPGLK